MTSKNLIYGICAGPSDKSERLALPSIANIDPEARVLVCRDQTSIHVAYNSMLEEAIRADAPGLILLHDDVVLRDPSLPSKLHSYFSTPRAGIAGVIGAKGVFSAEWWWYDTVGWVEETELVLDLGKRLEDVDVVDGLMLAFSPAAMRQVRWLPDAYPPFHGYDLEACSQVKACGLRVTTIPTDVHHDSYPHGKVTAPEEYRQADRVWRSRWRSGVRCDLEYRRAVVTSPLSWAQKLKRLASV